MKGVKKKRGYRKGKDGKKKLKTDDDDQVCGRWQEIRGGKKGIGGKVERSVKRRDEKRVTSGLWQRDKKKNRKRFWRVENVRNGKINKIMVSRVHVKGRDIRKSWEKKKAINQGNKEIQNA